MDTHTHIVHHKIKSDEGIYGIWKDGTDELIQNSNGDASLEAPTVKNLPAMQETWVQSLRQEDPLEKEMATPLQAVFLPKESNGQRSLVG